MELNSQAILDWIDKTIPRGIDFITMFAATALLFTASEFLHQYRTHPQRKFTFYLFLFFLVDGLDYLVFSLSGSILMDDATATLLGIVCDILVAATSLIFVFSSKSTDRAVQKDKTIDNPSYMH